MSRRRQALVKDATRTAEPRRRLPRWVGPAALLLLALLVLGWRVRAGADPFPGPSDDLVPRGVELADADNAFALLEQASSVGRNDEVEAKAETSIWEPAYGGSEGAATRSSYMRARAGALPLVHQALSRSGIAFPPATSGKPRPDALPSGIATLLEIASVERSDAGDQEGALDRCLELARLGRLLEGSGSSVFVYVRGLAFEEMGLAGIRRVVADPRPVRAAKLETTQKALERLEPDAAGAAESIKVEYQAYSALLDGYRHGEVAFPRLLASCEERSAGGPVPPNEELVPVCQKLALVDALYPRYMKPNQTQEWLAGSSRWTIERLERPPLPREEQELDKPVVAGHLDAGGTPTFGFVSDNGLGRTLHASAITLGAHLPRLLARERTSLAITRALVALREHRDSRGSLPASLDELVPALLPSVPLDGLDGSPLRYSREKAIVYSIGNDRKDVGGTLPGPNDSLWSLPNPASPALR